MDYLAPTACADEYTDALTLGPSFSCDHASIVVGAAPGDANAVLYQVARGKPGDWHWTLEREFTAIPQVFRVGGIVGIRFRNAVAGQAATVECYLIGPRDPDIQPGAPFPAVTATTRTLFLVAGNYDYFTPPYCRTLLGEVWAGGGGGGGAATTAAGQASFGHGGGGGGYASTLLEVKGGLKCPLTVGAGGAGGAAGANNGADGGFSEWSTDDLVITIRAKALGGSGGGGGIASIPPFWYGDGGPGGLGQIGDLIMDGEQGETTFAIANGAGKGGKGGAAARGAGGARSYSSPTAAAGINADPGGGGGSGAVACQSQPAQPGGNGGDGMVIFTEFY